jgi:hypothetical protein
VNSDGKVKSGVSPVGKSKDHQTSKDDGHTTSVAKSNGSPAEKAANDQGAAAPKAVAPAPSVPSGKSAPEAASPAAAKEAADGGG